MSGLEGMRAVLRGSLGRSLRSLGEIDRLSAAWSVACGRALAERGEIVRFADGILEVEVEDRHWLEQMQAMRGQLASETGRIAGIPVREIHFSRRGAERQPRRNAPPTSS